MFGTAKTIRNLQEKVERYQNEVIELRQQKRKLSGDLLQSYDHNKAILDESRKIDKEIRKLRDENEQLRAKLRDQNDADIVLLSLKAIKKAVTREGMTKTERGRTEKLMKSLQQQYSDAQECSSRRVFVLHGMKSLQQQYSDAQSSINGTSFGANPLTGQSLLADIFKP